MRVFNSLQGDHFAFEVHIGERFLGKEEGRWCKSIRRLQYAFEALGSEGPAL
jgi:hypothetical protein